MMRKAKKSNGATKCGERQSLPKSAWRVADPQHGKAKESPMMSNDAERHDAIKKYREAYCTAGNVKKKTRRCARMCQEESPVDMADAHKPSPWKLHK